MATSLHSTDNLERTIGNPSENDRSMRATPHDAAKDNAPSPVDMASLGLLRQDLINRFGIRETAEVLVRYGYICGAQAAKSSNYHHRISSDPTCLRKAFQITAQALNNLDMVASSSLPKDHPLWHVIEIENSLEAEQHMLQFGKHQTPACWFTGGYLSGYINALIPDMHYFYQEIECECAHNHHCLFVGKPKQDWGEDLSELTHQIDDIKGGTGLFPINSSQHRSKVDAIISSVSEIITDGRQINSEKGIEDAVVELSEAFGCTVSIEELGVVTYSCIHRNDRDPGGSVSPLLASLSLRSSSSFSHALNFYESKRQSFLVSDEVNGHTVNRLVCPLLANNRRLGYLSLIRIDFPFSEADKGLVEKVSGIFAKQIAEERYIQELKGKLMTAFVDNLITGNYEDSNPALDHSKELGFNLNLPSRMVVVEIHDPEGRLPPMPGAPQSDNWIQIIRRRAEQTPLGNAKMIIVYRDKHLVSILQDPEDHSTRRFCELAERLKDNLENSYPHLIFTLGVGSVCGSANDYARSFKSAYKIIELGVSLHRRGQVLSLEQFSSRALLYSSLDSEVMAEFAEIRLRPVLDFDEQNSAELFETLEAYVKNKGNAHKTAQDLNLSSIGLKYRLKNIEKITGVDIRETRTLFDLALALDIFQIIGNDTLS